MKRGGRTRLIRADNHHIRKSEETANGLQRPSCTKALTTIVGRKGTSQENKDNTPPTRPLKQRAVHGQVVALRHTQN